VNFVELSILTEVPQLRTWAELGLGVLPSLDYTDGFIPTTMMRGCEARRNFAVIVVDFS
jgi:hypothetical protein